MELKEDFRVYPTRLIQFRWFPRKWLITKHMNVEPETEILGARMGTVIHTVCEKFFSEINPELAKENPESHFVEVVKVLRQNNWDYKIPNEKIPIADEILKNFAVNSAYTYSQLLARKMEDKFYPKAVELELKSKLLPIGARIDRINQSFNCVDYKSDFFNPAEILFKPVAEQDDEDKAKFKYYMEALTIQAIFAAILIEEEYGILPKTFIYAYLRHLNKDGSKGIIEVEITREKIDRVKAWLNEMIEDVKADRFPHCTEKNPRACYYYNSPCEFRTFCDSVSLCIFSI